MCWRRAWRSAWRLFVLETQMVTRWGTTGESASERWRLARLDDHVVATRGVVEVDHARNNKHRALAPLVPEGAVRRVRADDADHRHRCGQLTGRCGQRHAQLHLAAAEVGRNRGAEHDPAAVRLV